MMRTWCPRPKLISWQGGTKNSEPNWEKSDWLTTNCPLRMTDTNLRSISTQSKVHLIIRIHCSCTFWIVWNFLPIFFSRNGLSKSSSSKMEVKLWISIFKHVISQSLFKMFVFSIWQNFHSQICRVNYSARQMPEITSFQFKDLPKLQSTQNFTKTAISSVCCRKMFKEKAVQFTQNSKNLLILIFLIQLISE